MAEDKKTISHEAGIPTEAPEQPSPVPDLADTAAPAPQGPEALTVEEQLILEHEGQAALFEMGEAIPDAPEFPGVTIPEQPEPDKPEQQASTPGKVVDFAAARVNLIVDIQERLRDRKGPAYERWAKIYNLKQMAAALQFMQEHGLTEYNQLAAQTEEAVQRFHVLTGQLRQTEANLAHTSEVMGAVVQYAKTRPVFDGYKATKYSKKYLAAHEAELADYRAAKAILNDLLDGARLPRMPELKEKRRTLAAQKKTLYADYRAAQQRMREAVAVKANIDHLLGLTDQRKNKEQER